MAPNAIGYGGQFMSLTVQSVSEPAPVIMAPTNMSATLQAGPQVTLIWIDNATNETGFAVERSTDGVTFSQIATAPARNNTGNVAFVNTTVAPGTTYTYRVAAASAAGLSAYSNTASAIVPGAPADPGNLTAVNGPDGNGSSRSVVLNWLDNSNNETGFTIQRATNNTFTAGLSTVSVAAGTTTLTQTGLSRATAYYYRIRADNGPFVWSGWVLATPFPIITNP